MQAIYDLIAVQQGCTVVLKDDHRGTHCNASEYAVPDEESLEKLLALGCFLSSLFDFSIRNFIREYSFDFVFDFLFDFPILSSLFDFLFYLLFDFVFDFLFDLYYLFDFLFDFTFDFHISFEKKVKNTQTIIFVPKWKVVIL
jgi:hypothetical protein